VNGNEACRIVRMSKFVEIRIRLLAAIAIGLATALVVHALTRDTSTSVSSWWRYASPRSESDPVVSLSGEDLSSSSDEAADSATPATPSLRSGALLIDGGDYTGPYDTPTPAVLATVTSSPAPDDEDDNDAGAQQAKGGVTVNTPVPASATSSDQDDFMVGGWTRRGGAYLPSNPSTGDGGLPWVGGQARGYAMLYALQPQARPVVEANVAALLTARVQEPYIAVLIDGTFGKDFGYLRELITRLNADGRNLHLGLYLANGPAQRRYRSPPYEAPFVRTPPEEFRREIRRSNSDAQIQYLNIIADARRLFEYNILTNPNAKNYAIVMLEDNLERDSFRAMSNLAREQLEAVATIVRNPCNRCHAGNDNESLGYAVEEHPVERFELLNAGDGYTLDGQSFAYPTEVIRGKAVTPEQLISLLKGAYQRDLQYFGLWRHSWQGTGDGVPLTEPKSRVYTPSNPDEMGFEIQALRAGLPVVDSDDDVQEDAEDGQFFDQMGAEGR
jgi:hypothetical protein